MNANWVSLKRWFGFEKPYNFRVAIPFLLNSGLLLAVLTLALYWKVFRSGNINYGTMRFYFFLYLTITLLLGAILSKKPRIALTLFLLCFIEFAFATTSDLLARFGIGNTHMPRNAFANSDERFVYHPLLQATPKPNFRSKGGKIVEHNAQGLRGIDIEDSELHKKFIFFYGGSTTYDVGVDQGDTWVEQLQGKMRDRYVLLNHGVPGYSTSEHIVQTAFYESFKGKQPICAVYYVGWNDIRNVHIPNLDNAYANYHLPSQITNLSARKPEIAIAKYSPLLNLLYVKLKNRLDSLPFPPDLSKAEAQSGSDSNLEEIFKKNISTLASINHSRGIKPVFIGQVLNRSKLVSELKNAWFPLLRDKDVWPLQSRFNEILGKESTRNAAFYIDAGIDNFQDSDFLDDGHFLSAGSKKFASQIYQQIAKHCT